MAIQRDWNGAMCLKSPNSRWFLITFSKLVSIIVKEGHLKVSFFCCLSKSSLCVIVKTEKGERRIPMKHISLMKRITMILLCLLTVFTLVSCTADRENGENTHLGETFLNYAIKDDYPNAYALLKTTVSEPDFANYWDSIQQLIGDSLTYTLKQIGWNVSVSNGLTTRISAYRVYLENGKIAMFQVVTRDDIEGIAGMHFSDVTEFLAQTDAVVPVFKIVLLVVSLLVYAFVIWMLVDCIRRKLKRKVIWMFLIFLGVAFTVTVGKQTGIKFMIGLISQNSTMDADPSILAIVTKLVVPVGAIVYFFLRKKITLGPDPVIVDISDTENQESL